MQAINAEATTTVESVDEQRGESPPAASPTTRLSKRAIAWTAILSVAVTGLTLILINKLRVSRATEATRVAAAPAPRALDSGVVQVADDQMQSIKLEPVVARSFRAEKTATGKIGFNEDVMTPVFSPYAGRVLRLLAKPGDAVGRGSPLFEIDTPDLVQAEQDLIAAGIAVPKAKTALDLATRAEDRQHRLYANKAVALKDWEQAEADLKNAQRDLHSAENALTAARSKLHVFGKSDQEIEKIENERQIDRVARVGSPLTGTIVARKVGPGQFVKPDSPDPLLTIADLSTVWLLADVYESDAPPIKAGQSVEVHVSAFPNETFTARIAYIGASVDPTTHRVAVRSVVQNRGRKLKPEMFASFRVVTDSEVASLAVPLSAVVHEGNKTSVWMKQSRNAFARREVTLGLEQGGYAQVLSGLQAGDQVVSEGSIFISNVASS
jgi:cobalt-zinc-cadmium efflux system membrane fusion protein